MIFNCVDDGCLCLFVIQSVALNAFGNGKVTAIIDNFRIFRRLNIGSGEGVHLIHYIFDRTGIIGVPKRNVVFFSESDVENPESGILIIQEFIYGAVILIRQVDLISGDLVCDIVSLFAGKRVLAHLILDGIPRLVSGHLADIDAVYG